MNEIKRITKTLQRADDRKNLGESGAGFRKNKVYNVGDAKDLLYCLLEDISIELNVKIDSEKLKKTIYG